MVPMRNDQDVAKTVRRGPIRYDADPGEIIEVYRFDVPRLAAAGFSRVEEEISSDETPDDLDDLTVDQLRDLARDAEIEGRSNMNRAELVSALSNPQE